MIIATAKTAALSLSLATPLPGMLSLVPLDHRLAAGDEHFFENAQAIFRKQSECLFAYAKVYSPLLSMGVTSSKSLD